MSFPSLITLESGNNQWLEWGPMVDGLSLWLSPSTPTYINDLTITAKLYQGKVPYDPNQPGIQVATFGTLTLPYVAASNGLYRVIVPSTFVTPYGSNYVLVIDATDGIGYQGHWEVPATVIPRAS